METAEEKTEEVYTQLPAKARGGLYSPPLIPYGLHWTPLDSSPLTSQPSLPHSTAKSAYTKWSGVHMDFHH